MLKIKDKRTSHAKINKEYLEAALEASSRPTNLLLLSDVSGDTFFCCLQLKEGRRFYTAMIGRLSENGKLQSVAHVCPSVCDKTQVDEVLNFVETSVQKSNNVILSMTKALRSFKQQRNEKI